MQFKKLSWFRTYLQEIVFVPLAGTNCLVSLRYDGNTKGINPGFLSIKQNIFIARYILVIEFIQFSKHARIFSCICKIAIRVNEDAIIRLMFTCSSSCFYFQLLCVLFSMIDDTLPNSSVSSKTNYVINKIVIQEWELFILPFEPFNPPLWQTAEWGQRKAERHHELIRKITQ